MTNVDDGAQTIDASNFDDEMSRRAKELPWWNRPRRMRRQLSFSLAAVSLVSVVLVGALNFVAASDLLQEGTEERLVSVAEGRTRSIENGAERLLTRVSALSSDLAVADALEAFIEGFPSLAESDLTEAELDELETFYAADVVDPLVEVGAQVTVEELFPPTPQSQYLQSNYTIASKDGSAIINPGDGSAYSAVHEQFHPYLADLAVAMGADDIMLISLDGDIVYSVNKETDFGTNVQSGPYADTTLAETLVLRLPLARAGDAVISDFELYIPNGAQPTAFAMASVRSGTELLGALVVEIPIDGLNAITTANSQWEEVGLSDGESYLVGEDSILRSESRLWIEDPEQYLSEVDDELLAEQIRFLDSPVGLQPADTKAVRAALDGEIFSGRSSNYLGQEQFSYARLIDISGVNWVVVADIPIRSAQDPLYDYLLRIGLTLAILLPAAALIGSLMARRVTRPIPVILDVAGQVVDGERDPQIQDFGRNEFGDLATRLARTARRLGRQEADLEAQYDETRAVLLAALPPRAVRDGRNPTSDADQTDLGTAIAIAIDLASDDLSVDDALGDLLASASAAAEELAAERGIERVRAAADRYLFIAGLGETDDGTDRALDFAATYARRVTDFAAAEEISVRLQIGVATGTIETGLMTRGGLAYTAWGEPVRTAMMIGSLSDATTVGVAASTVTVADQTRWTFEEAPPVAGLNDDEQRVFGLDLDAHTTPDAADPTSDHPA